MNADPPNVRIAVDGAPENVVLVRETLTGVAESVGLDGADLSDIRTAVTEACNNVVMHAYHGAPGPMQVDIELEPRALHVIVRDHGVGFDPQRAGAPAADPGIGLPVIESLAERVRYAEPAGGEGTEVHMEFATPQIERAARPAGRDAAEAAANAIADPQEEETDAAAVVLDVTPSELARNVLPRLMCVLAARAAFSIDRISDAEMLADALAAHASEAISGDHLRTVILVSPRELEVRVGPLAAGRADRLVHASDLGGLGPVLEKLADSHTSTSSASHDTLTLQMREPE